MAEDMDYRLCKEDVDLGPIERNCGDCDERPATCYISLDLGFMITSVGDGEYCDECGKEELERIRGLLPSREDAK
jgi:hypothetical protein